MENGKQNIIMKKITTIFILLFSVTLVQAQEVKWMSMNEALKAQKKHPKKILMDAYTPWCGPCKMMEKNTFSNENVAEFINENYYAVKFNAEGTEEVTYQDEKFGNPYYDANKSGRNSQHEFAAALNITGYPSMIFFDEEGQVIAPLVGYRTPSQLEIFLKMFANDDYKELTTQEAWDKYQQNFKGSFTN